MDGHNDHVEVVKDEEAHLDVVKYGLTGIVSSLGWPVHQSYFSSRQSNLHFKSTYRRCRVNEVVAATLGNRAVTDGPDEGEQETANDPEDEQNLVWDLGAAAQTTKQHCVVTHDMYSVRWKSSSSTRRDKSKA